MKLLVSVLTAMVSTSAMAIDIAPTPNQALCFQRVYDQKHLKAVPAQQMSELTVKVYTEVGTDPKNPYTQDTAIVVGKSTKNGKFYGNTAWYNSTDKEGNAKYAIDCDGGSFSLNPRADKKSGEEWVNFVVTKDYYFPLYMGDLEPDMDKFEKVTDYQLSLDGNDAANNTWRMESVPLNKCEEKIKQITENEGGC